MNAHRETAAHRRIIARRAAACSTISAAIAAEASTAATVPAAKAAARAPITAPRTLAAASRHGFGRDRRSRLVDRTMGFEQGSQQTRVGIAVQRHT
jgi:hypothetical protein